MDGQRKKVVMVPDSNFGYVEIDGAKYRLKSIEEDKDGHMARVEFEEMSDSEWKTLIGGIADDLVKKTGLTAGQILKDALGQMPAEDLKKIRQGIDAGQPVRTKWGCLSIYVGKEEVPVIG